MEKTIVAISTASGNGGIGIIRLSGKDTFKIIDRIFIPKNKKKEIKGYNIKYGNIVNPKNNETIDNEQIENNTQNNSQSNNQTETNESKETEEVVTYSTKDTKAIFFIY